MFSLVFFLGNTIIYFATERIIIPFCCFLLMVPLIFPQERRVHFSTDSLGVIHHSASCVKLGTPICTMGVWYVDVEEISLRTDRPHIYKYKSSNPNFQLQIKVYSKHSYATASPYPSANSHHHSPHHLQHPQSSSKAPNQLSHPPSHTTP